MVLSYGEILADMIGRTQNGVLSYDRYAGGAPLNVACACSRAGGKSGFVGCVGNDLIGEFLSDFASAQNFEVCSVSKIEDRNTTLAFVQLSDDGERSFCFYRKNTADYAMKEEALPMIDRADIVHLGSLMLSEKEGREFADKLVGKVKKAGKKLSFDINYRDDIFPDPERAKKIYSEYAEAADIVKYSEEELEMFTGKKGFDGLKSVARENKLVCVTLGSKGSAYALGSRTGAADSIKVKVVDTTGAGDAFYGALLSKLDGKDFSALSDKELGSIFRFANVAGALATTARGAIDGLPTKERIETLI